MPICRICGCEFKGNGSGCGVEICRNQVCWKKAWDGMRNPILRRIAEEKGMGASASRQIPKNEDTGDMRKYRRISEKVKRRVIELHKEGATRKEIAAITGLKYNTVSYIIRDSKCD